MGRGKASPRLRLTVGEAPLWAGMGDATNRGTHAESRDRKRKFAYSSLSFSIGLWDSPETAHLFLLSLFFSEGGVGGECGEGSSFVPRTRLDVR